MCSARSYQTRCRISSWNIININIRTYTYTHLVIQLSQAAHRSGVKPKVDIFDQTIIIIHIGGNASSLFGFRLQWVSPLNIYIYLPAICIGSMCVAFLIVMCV